jgi:hypothetical protein
MHIYLFVCLFYNGLDCDKGQTMYNVKGKVIPVQAGEALKVVRG